MLKCILFFIRKRDIYPDIQLVTLRSNDLFKCYLKKERKKEITKHGPEYIKMKREEGTY